MRRTHRRFLIAAALLLSGAALGCDGAGSNEDNDENTFSIEDLELTVTRKTFPPPPDIGIQVHVEATNRSKATFRLTAVEMRFFDMNDQQLTFDIVRYEESLAPNQSVEMVFDRLPELPDHDAYACYRYYVRLISGNTAKEGLLDGTCGS